MFRTRKLITFSMGYGKLDMMVNDYGVGEGVVQSGHRFQHLKGSGKS